MKKANLKEVQLLALHKITINNLYGGINDDGDNEDEGASKKPDKPNKAPNNHTRGCASWNIAC